jgi:monoamine oxidase
MITTPALFLSLILQMVKRKPIKLKPPYNKMNTVDVIIIGSGIAGLYAAYQIKRLAPANTTFLILEKNPKKLMGGRAVNEKHSMVRMLLSAQALVEKKRPCTDKTTQRHQNALLGV